MSHAVEVRPFVVGQLSSEQALAFSGEFYHDRNSLLLHDMLADNDSLYLPDLIEADLPDDVRADYAQFLPALAIAVKHESATRGSLMVTDRILTIRQGHVEAGESQQGIRGREYHRDARGPKDVRRIYCVSDVVPTEYFPDIPSTAATPDRDFFSERDEVSPVSFEPFQIVHSSGMTYHRSPEMFVAGLRTFLRLTYYYKS